MVKSQPAAAGRTTVPAELDAATALAAQEADNYARAHGEPLDDPAPPDGGDQPTPAPTPAPATTETSGE